MGFRGSVRTLITLILQFHNLIPGRRNPNDDSATCSGNKLMMKIDNAIY